MKKSPTIALGTALLVPLLSLSFAAPSLAQGPGGRQPRGGFDGPPDGPRFGGMRPDGMRGPGGMRPDGMRPGGMRGPRGQMQLERLWRGIGMLEETTNPISKAQAQKITNLMLPWVNKPKMSDSEAQALATRLEGILTSAQKEQLDEPPFGPPRGDGPPFGAPEGDGPPFGGPPEDFGPPFGGPRDGGPRGGGPRDGGPRDGGPRGGRPFDGPRGEGPLRGQRPAGGEFDGPPQRGGRGGGQRGGRGGAGRGDGPRGMRGMGDLTAAQSEAVRTWVETSNPFYAPTGAPTWKSLPAPFQTRITRRYKKNRATLEELSRKGKS